MHLFLWLFLLWPAFTRAEVQLGSETLVRNGFRELKGKRIGLITNPSGVNHKGQWTVDILRRAPGVRLVALFGPEHGLYGTVLAGDKVDDAVDKRTGLPIRSLYGKTRKPTPAMLQGLDALVYDVQDIGCRSYTFISTMGMAMEACAEAGIEFIVLDRPNPLGGLRVEGPMLDPQFRSFVGRWDVPYVYGMTCGELARMINGERWISKHCKLTVIPMRGWKRGMAWNDTGLKWVPTSPKIPKATSPLHYVSTGILGEIGGVNIGMGFAMPFQCVTASWLDARQVASQCARHNLPGVRFLPFSTTNNAKILHGVEIVFTDTVKAPLVAINFLTLEAVRNASGRDLFAEAVQEQKNFAMFDKVTGTDRVRLALQARQPASNIVASWKPGEDSFRKQRQRYLLYW